MLILKRNLLADRVRLGLYQSKFSKVLQYFRESLRETDCFVFVYSQYILLVRMILFYKLKGEIFKLRSIYSISFFFQKKLVKFKKIVEKSIRYLTLCITLWFLKKFFVKIALENLIFLIERVSLRIFFVENNDMIRLISFFSIL